jgi:hypothetical protein
MHDHKLLRRREGDYMRKRVFLSVIVIAIFIPLYYLVSKTSNETILHTDINIADAESVTINDRTYNNKYDSEIITKKYHFIVVQEYIYIPYLYSLHICT